MNPLHSRTSCDGRRNMHAPKCCSIVSTVHTCVERWYLCTSSSSGPSILKSGMWRSACVFERLRLFSSSDKVANFPAGNLQFHSQTASHTTPVCCVMLSQYTNRESFPATIIIYVFFSAPSSLPSYCCLSSDKCASITALSCCFPSSLPQSLLVSLLFIRPRQLQDVAWARHVP